MPTPHPERRPDPTPAKDVLLRLADSHTLPELQARLRQELLSALQQRQLREKALQKLTARKLARASPLARFAHKLGLRPKDSFKTAEVVAEMRRLRDAALRSLVPGEDGRIASKEELSAALKGIGLDTDLAKRIEGFAEKMGAYFGAKAPDRNPEDRPKLKKELQKDLGTKELHFETKTKQREAAKEKLPDGLVCSGIKKSQETPFTIKLVKIVDGKAVDQVMLEANSDRELRALMKAVSGRAKDGESLGVAAEAARTELAASKQKDRSRGR